MTTINMLVDADSIFFKVAYGSKDESDLRVHYDKFCRKMELTIKDKLASNLSTAPLFDTKLFTKHLESAYTEMYERHHKGLEPDHIYVEV